MPNLNYTVNINGVGATINQTVQRTGDGGDCRAVTLQPGYAGSLTTRTSGTAGVVTTSSTPTGITTSTPVDIYWSGGCAYGCTVTGVSGDAITFDSASGTSLPAATTAVVICVQTTVYMELRSAGLVFCCVEQSYNTTTETAQSHIDFQDSASGEVLSLTVSANTPWVNDVAGGQSSQFAGGTGNPVAKALASNGSATNVATLNMVWLCSSTM